MNSKQPVASLLPVLVATTALAQVAEPPTFVLDFETERTTLAARPGDVVTLEVLATMHMVEDPVGDGIQGWSLSVAADGATVIAADVEGLAMEDRAGEPQELSSAWFQVTDVAADPDEPDRSGAVQAIVGLGYPGPHEMFPRDPTPVIRLTLEVEVFDRSCPTITLSYEDGFRSFGQPLMNAVTWFGDVLGAEQMTRNTLDICVVAGESRFQRGDPNEDDAVNISDSIFILNYLFLGEVEASCDRSLDTNDDGQLNLTDAVALFRFLFNGGARPPEPFGRCGEDPTPDEVSCLFFEPCA